MVNIENTYIASSINANTATIKNDIREWVHNVLAGKFYLKGNNPITKFGLWPLIQKTCSEAGWCVFAKVGGDLFRVANISNLVTNDTGEVEKVTVAWLNPLGGTQAGGKSELTQELSNEKEFVLALNTFDRSPNLSTSSMGLNYLDAIYKAMIFDLEVSRPRLFIKTHFYPTPDQRKRIKDNMDAYNAIVFASLGDGKPMEFHPWLPESKQPQLKSMWDWQFSLFRRLNGIAHNTSKKEERHTAAEVQMVTEQFESYEMLWQQEREKFLRECYEKFGGEEYTLMLDGEEVFQIGDKFVEEEIKPSKKKQDKEDKDEPKEDEEEIEKEAEESENK